MQSPCSFPRTTIPRTAANNGKIRASACATCRLGPTPADASLALLGLALARAARRTTPDVIHVFKPKGVTGIAQLALWALRQQRVVLDIDDWEGRGGWNERGQYSALSRHMFAWQELWGIRHASALTAASQTLIGQARNLDVPAQRLSYVPNGVDETLYAQWRDADGERIRAHYGLADRPVVLLYSRFFEFGVERAAAIFTRVAHAVPQSMLLVVGSGPHGEEQDLAACLARAGLGDRVVLAGWQEPSCLARIRSGSGRCAISARRHAAQPRQVPRKARGTHGGRPPHSGRKRRRSRQVHHP